MANGGRQGQGGSTDVPGGAGGRTFTRPDGGGMEIDGGGFMRSETGRTRPDGGEGIDGGGRNRPDGGGFTRETGGGFTRETGGGFTREAGGGFTPPDA